MRYICHYCQNETYNAHSITLYQDSGVEERIEVLCDSCYADWLLAQQG